MRQFITYGKVFWSIVKSFDDRGSRWPQALALLVLITTPLVCMAFAVFLFRAVMTFVRLWIR